MLKKSSIFMFRFLTACGAVGLFNEAFTLTVELVGSREIVPWLPWITYKNLLGNTIQVYFNINCFYICHKLFRCLMP